MKAATALVAPHRVELGADGAQFDASSLVRVRELAIPLFLAVAGFSPITALAIAIFGWAPLWIAAPLLVLPSSIATIVLTRRHPRWGGIALRGFLIGLAAVTLYDGFRLPFVFAGVWGDFIPRIGGWLLNGSHENAVVGYCYRYFGDGGGMCMSFVALFAALKPPLRPLPAAVGFGAFVWLCLIATLVWSPHGQQMLFALTPTNLTLSFVGHLIYGAAVGLGYEFVFTGSLRSR